MQTFLIKIDRLAAWVLFLGFFLYFVSGYGMTKGIIDPILASKLHLNYLTYIIVVAFVVHTSFAIRLAFIRWGLSNNWSAFVLTLFYLLFISGFIYVDRYYVKPLPADTSVNMPIINGDTSDQSSTVAPASPAVTETPVQVAPTVPTVVIPVSTPAPAPVATSAPSVKTFTLAELAKYNGKNGTKAYVAVDGNVYDLTAVFAGGKHASHFAGTELTNAFYSYHAKKVLAKYPIVGQLVK